MKPLLKKLSVLALCVVCLMGLAACSGSQTAASSGSGEAASSASSEASSQEATEASSSATSQEPTNEIAIGERALVVYYSATGTTAEVAGMIANATNAEMFEVVPVQVYTTEDLDYNDESSRVSQEHADVTLQQVDLVTTEVPDWESYDTVFIGYPIWWGEAAWPIDGFVAANDFTGKNVIPFCTSASSELGDSATELQALNDTGTWAAGMRFGADATQEAVNDWIQTFILDMND